MKKLRALFFVLLFISSCSEKSAPTTIIIDDRVSSNVELSKLDSTDIYSSFEWSLSFEDAMPSKYRKYGTDIVEVTTWDYERRLQENRYDFLSHSLRRATKGDSILFIYNGLEVPTDKLSQLNALQPKDLKSIDTLKIAVASKIYGKSAKAVNIIINTYDLSGDLVK